MPASDDAKFEDAQEVLQELTELTALLATELRGVTGRLSAVVQDQMQVMDTLAQVEARVAALEATRDPAPAGMPAEPDERGAREALRREVQQTARHTRELVSESRALVTQAEEHPRDWIRTDATRRLSARSHRRKTLPLNARSLTAHPRPQASGRTSEPPD